MSDFKYYHVTEKGLEEGERLGRISVVLKADYDALKAEVERLRVELGKRTMTVSMLYGDIDFLQSELTKARGLISDLVRSPDAVMVPLHLWKHVQALAHQPAPAAKD